MPNAIVIFPATLLAAIIHVPQDEPTIQAGVSAAAPYDTVVVACGTYYENNIVSQWPITIRSETELPDCVTIDGAGQGPIFLGNTGIGSLTITGITFTRGFAEHRGGGQPVDHRHEYLEEFCPVRRYL